MTVSPDAEAEIRRLFFAEHWKRGTIAAQLALHPDVVERVIGHLGPKPKAVPALVPAPLELFVGFLDETLARYPRLVGTRLFDMLRARGYRGSLRTLRRHLRRVRPMPKREAFLRLQPLVGEQAQVDWAHVGYLQVPGGRRALWVFVIVLAYSRAMWAELVLDLSVHSLRRSLVRAAVFFGGCARQWLFDNPKTVVLERHGDAVRFHPGLLEIAGALRVEPRVCGVRKPQEKGGVERAIRFLRERFFAARTLHSVAQGNAQLLEFLTTLAAPRPHPRWPDRSVADVFAEERRHLLALPAVLPSTALVQPAHVDKTAFVRFDGNAYSAPSIFARATLTLVADDERVRLLNGAEEVASHIRAWGRRQWIEEPAHRAALLEQKRAAKHLKGRDRLRAEVDGIDRLFERWVEAGRNLGSMTARTLTLLDLYGADVLRAAVHDAMGRGTHDPGALAILCEQARCALARPVPIPLELGAHIPDRDVVPHDLGGYDE
ncbi:MAG TPA: IS21 family transposase [Thermoleophilaceae bacterium]|jgi:transposase